MPIKTVTCIVCRDIVAKRQTYATGKTDADGNALRACRKHKGIGEVAERARKEENARLQATAGVKILRERLDRARLDVKPLPPISTPEAIWADTHCWCCAAGDDRPTTLFELSDYMYKRYEQWRARITRKAKNAVERDKAIRLCRGCQKKTGLHPEPKRREHASK